MEVSIAQTLPVEEEPVLSRHTLATMHGREVCTLCHVAWPCAPVVAELDKLANELEAWETGKKVWPGLRLSIPALATDQTMRKCEGCGQELPADELVHCYACGALCCLECTWETVGEEVFCERCEPGGPQRES